MMEMYHLKLLNQVLITFCGTPTLEYTLKIKGHFACRSHCALGCKGHPWGNCTEVAREAATYESWESGAASERYSLFRLSLNS